ncbi:(deoxy)nucleoside triphosphate pyrophosphohydrolase [Rothia halotolerans]|uniref:(deoxy)nucleoside triphosphate pyrophosphohydrolase n=1 Tax=Rothia halotolerans TaxID=405770 RepID=UPI0018768410|nr:(deoxy)nucleoside triphosphate pyrophosphohydrolase [Rothia halotolerans]
MAEPARYPVQVVGAALIDDAARLLVARRSYPAALEGLWEFPGGKVEPGEGCRDALRRELVEELGVGIEVGEELAGPHPQGWPLGERAAMRVYTARLASGVPRAGEDHSELRWMDLSAGEALLSLDWIPADLPIVRALLGRVGGQARAARSIP